MLTNNHMQKAQRYTEQTGQIDYDGGAPCDISPKYNFYFNTSPEKEEKRSFNHIKYLLDVRRRKDERISRLEQKNIPKILEIKS